MFERRDDLIRFLAVAETGKILAAADKLAITQPALSRVITRLEARFKGSLFERLPSGVRLTPLGAMAADLARHLLREMEAAEEKIDAAVSGRTGSFRITAGPVWMQAVLPGAVARFHDAFPGVEIALHTTARTDGIRLLANGESDLHCGGIDTDEPLPEYLRRERFADMAWGIVAHRDHPLHARHVSCDDLAEYPWIDYDAPLHREVGHKQFSLGDSLERLCKGTSKRVRTIIRAGSAGLFLMGTGPYLSWLSLRFLEKLPGVLLAPLAPELGTCRHHTGIISRRSAESLPAFRRFEEIVREVALGRGG